MTATNSNLNSQARKALYMLKREYGAQIDIHQLISSETNVRTGQKEVVANVTRIRRAIVLPARVERVAQLGISKISANKEFAFGGTYDSASREFIIDRRDIPTLPELSADDWIVFNGRKYQVKTVEAFEYDTGWIITTKELVGASAGQVHSLQASTTLTLSHTPANEVE